MTERFNNPFKHKQTALTRGEIEELIRLLGEEKAKPQSAVMLPQVRADHVIQVIDLARQLFAAVRETNSIPLELVQKQIVPLILHIVETKNVIQLFDDLKQEGSYETIHCAAVAIISSLLGKWLKLSREEHVLLTTAAVLHDIGMALVPQEVLEKPSSLTSDEFEQVRMHTIYGFELCGKNSAIHERIALVTLQHHERENGNGYPFGLLGHQIDDFAKIVSIADVFHAMSTERVYTEAKSFFTTMKQMNIDAFGKLNANYFLTFMQNLMDCTVGHEVVLSNNERGTIIYINPYNPLLPLIRLQNDEIIDLSKEENLQVERIIPVVR